MSTPRTRNLTLILVPLFLVAALSAGPVRAGDLVQTVKIPFNKGQRASLDINVGALRVTEVANAEDSAPVFASLLPPHGGQSRYGWVNYAVRAENSSDSSHTLAVRVRLLDKNGAVIDEFSFRGRVRRGRYRELDLRRLTLNYVIPLIETLELTVSQE